MTATDEALHLTRVAAEVANEKKGLDIVAFDVSERLAITDVFLLVSANNERLVGAIVDAIEERLIEREGRRPARREGERQNRWVLLDYIDLVVHVQHSEERSLFALERLWKDCPRIDLGLSDVDSTPSQVGDEDAL